MIRVWLQCSTCLYQSEAKGMVKMKSVKKLFCETASNVMFALKTSFLASSKYFTYKCIIVVVNTVIPLVTIWLWKMILNGITNRMIGSLLVLWCILYFVLGIVSRILDSIDSYIERRYNEATDFYMESVMVEKTAKMNLSCFDSSSMADKIRFAQDNSWVMEETTWTVFTIVSDILNVLSAVVIAVSIHPLIALLSILFVIPYAINYKKYIDSLTSYEDDTRTDERKLEYITSIFLDEKIHFEMKLNNIGSYFLDYFAKLKENILRIGTKLDIKLNVQKSLIGFLNYGGEAMVLAYSIYNVLDGKSGIGDLQYNIGIISRLRQNLNSFLVNIVRFMNHNERLNDLRAFIDMETESEISGTKVPSNNPRIEFCHVYFRYPNTEVDVLKDCCFVIEPHERVGLVGLNGSGKTTIIKLMFRFYDPQKGCIKLDGVDIKEYDVYALRRIFGVLFQDIVQYNLPLREVIALSDFKERFNEEKLDWACQISGANKMIHGWQRGYDSVLGRRYERDGKDLSGGQWQILSLARTYFRESRCMILDEPSASLDPITEEQIFQQMYKVSSGKSSVTISQVGS